MTTTFLFDHVIVAFSNSSIPMQFAAMHLSLSMACIFCGGVNWYELLRLGCKFYMFVHPLTHSQSK